MLLRMPSVAPFTGAWIEILVVDETRRDRTVAPFTGAWIEIGTSFETFVNKYRRSLHGGVD